jgi:ppGpp synthetase/RelA/SpoT-type nucleotidyltranferase
MTVQPRVKLSWRLCIAITSVVVAVMVAVSLPQQMKHRQQMRHRTERWVQTLAEPIARAMRSDGPGREVDSAIQEFRATSAVVLGQLPAVAVKRGATVEFHGEKSPTWRGSMVIAKGEGSGSSSLRAIVDFDDFDEAGGMGAYWIHVLATATALSASLYFVLRWLVAKPLERLLDGVRLMEMGYWGEAPEPSGVWEIRWLGQRFREMGLRMDRTVKNLVAAERRGGRRVHDAARTSIAAIAVPSTRETASDPNLEDATEARAALLARLKMLERARPGDVEAGVLAKEMLERDPALAEQLGEIDLKTRVEDRAFAILDPESFADLRGQVGGLVPKLLRQADEAELRLARALDAAGIPVVHAQRRIKGLGSIWRKMQRKKLLLSQVHDLLAIRVVLLTADDCYRALHVVHSEFEPIVGRFKDYIADPKTNGYQSMHTSIRLRSGTVCEIQLRTESMHELAEVGDYAHWRYRLEPPSLRSHLEAGDG